MGTMLMTKSTPRITYRIGIRAGLGALTSRSPGEIRKRPSIEVAAGFTCIYRSLLWKEWLEAENRAASRYQSVSGKLASGRALAEKRTGSRPCLTS